MPARYGRSAAGQRARKAHQAIGLGDQISSSESGRESSYADCESPVLGIDGQVARGLASPRMCRELRTWVR
jgi:hypothetical protein